MLVRIEIGPFEFTEVWDGTLYKKLSAYPQVTDWEIRTLMEFAAYEKAHGRECCIDCENEELLEEIRQKMQRPESYMTVPRPELITECTACRHHGCKTDWVCHTASPENAKSIFRSGWLLSAVKARGVPAQQLADEPRNAARDPEDYFEYVMLGWGNCQAGDRLVMERKLGRFPTEEELEAQLTPGVRFYFRYDSLVRHPAVVFDGVLPMKARDGICLKDWVDCIVIPTGLREELESCIPQGLRSRVIWLAQEGEGLWAWAEKVYHTLEQHFASLQSPSSVVR